MVPLTSRPSESRRSDTKNRVEYGEIVADKELEIYQHDGGCSGVYKSIIF